jgi:hypothetical protein
MYANAELHARHFGPPPFIAGQRVSAHPATSAFMKGDRYGVVERVGRALVHVRMNRSGRLLSFHPANLEPIA